MLHTWDQTLKDHFHLHCLVPAGALSLDQSRWISARKNFLFPVKALSRVFRGKFLGLLQRPDRGKIQRPTRKSKPRAKRIGSSMRKSPSAHPTPFSTTSAATPTVWLFPMIVFSQSKTAKSLLSYRDRKDGDRKKTMTLDAHEFIRRFLLHVLPDGFMRIRHFGFLANRSKKQALAQCRKLLDSRSGFAEISYSLSQRPG